MNSLIGLDAVSITAIAIITAVIIMNKCSANPIAVRTESIEKTRSSTTICAITPENYLLLLLSVFGFSVDGNFDFFAGLIDQKQTAT